MWSEGVICHATFCGLVKRETLSVFCTSFVFTHEVGEMFVLLWPTVAAELQALAGLMMFFVSSWELAADACDTRWEACRAVHKRAFVASVGRVWERDRCLSPDHVSAHVAALGASSLSPQMLHDTCEGAPTGLELVEKPSSQEVPQAMIHLRDWATLCALQTR